MAETRSVYCTEVFEEEAAAVGMSGEGIDEATREKDKTRTNYRADLLERRRLGHELRRIYERHFPFGRAEGMDPRERSEYYDLFARPEHVGGPGDQCVVGTPEPPNTGADREGKPAGDEIIGSDLNGADFEVYIRLD